MRLVRMPSSTTLSVMGLILSLYAVHVEHKMENEEDDFTALCDIEQIGASCSSVFTLPQGHLVSYFGLVPKGHALDVPNALLGACYYIYMLVCTGMVPIFTTQFAASLALTTSLFLAYQLTLLNELCILCWTTHVINACLWYKTVHLAAHYIQKKKET